MGSTQAPLQLTNPCWQLRKQFPVEQACPEEQTLRQLPQLALSVAVLAQYGCLVPWPQSVSPVWHSVAHLPAEHSSPVEHAAPQEPQLSTACWRSTHLPLQLLVPAAQQSP